MRTYTHIIKLKSQRDDIASPGLLTWFNSAAGKNLVYLLKYWVNGKSSVSNGLPPWATKQRLC